jgi:hypothetical protein
MFTVVELRFQQRKWLKLRLNASQLIQDEDSRWPFKSWANSVEGSIILTTVLTWYIRHGMNEVCCLLCPSLVVGFSPTPVWTRRSSVDHYTENVDSIFVTHVAAQSVQCSLLSLPLFCFWCCILTCSICSIAGGQNVSSAYLWLK